MVTGSMKLAAANRGAIERWEETFGRRWWLGRETGHNLLFGREAGHNVGLAGNLIAPDHYVFQFDPATRLNDNFTKRGDFNPPRTK